MAQLAICHRLWGTERGDVAVLARAESRTWRVWSVFTLHRATATESAMLQRLRDWYQRHVIDGEPPGLDGTAATSAAMQRVWSPVDQTAQATPKDLQRWQELCSVRDAMDELAGRRRELEQQLQRRMETATVLEGPAGKLATWRARKGSESIDLAALRTERPDIAKKYTRRGSPGRTFSLKRSTDGR